METNDNRDYEGLGYETAVVAADVVAATSAEALQSALADLLRTATDFEVDPRTFEEAGVLTLDLGLVVRTPSGVEFQVTVVRSA